MEKLLELVDFAFDSDDDKCMMGVQARDNRPHLFLRLPTYGGVDLSGRYFLDHVFSGTCDRMPETLIRLQGS